jgi:hypothetical protein
MATVSHPSPATTDAPPAASPVDAHRSPVEGTGKKSGKATTAMVLGILGCLTFFIPIAAWILGGIAIGFGITARQELRTAAADRAGRATAGLVLGIIAVALGIAMAALNVALMT